MGGSRKTPHIFPQHKNKNTMKTATKQTYTILSPDGFTIEHEYSYPTPSKAKTAFRNWVKRYERQGYYSSVNYGRIDLKELEYYCQFIVND